MTSAVGVDNRNIVRQDVILLSHEDSIDAAALLNFPASQGSLAEQVLQTTDSGVRAHLGAAGDGHLSWVLPSLVHLARVFGDTDALNAFFTLGCKLLVGVPDTRVIGRVFQTGRDDLDVNMAREVDGTSHLLFLCGGR